MKKLSSLLACGLLLLAPALAGADVIVVEENGDRVVKVRKDQSVPTRGMTMQAVESEFGEPNQRIPAVGEPPISRWEYDGFTVYFEHDRVLHSVISSS